MKRQSAKRGYYKDGKAAKAIEATVPAPVIPLQWTPSTESPLPTLGTVRVVDVQFKPDRPDLRTDFPLRVVGTKPGAILYTLAS